MKIYNINGWLPAVIIFSALVSCSNESTEKKEAASPVKKDTPVVEKKAAEEVKRPPIINMMDTLSVKRTVVYMKDSAASYDRIKLKLSEIYGVKLMAVLKKNNLKMTGQPMAWYTTSKPPFFFEAGVPVDKKPGKLPTNTYLKEIGTDSVVVAHFYGKYDQIPAAYEALNDWIKDRKKKLKAKPYEIYVDDPMDKDGKLKDPYKVQTDVVFTWK